MKLYFLKQKALDYLKTNIRSLYVNYYREDTNQWIKDLFDYDPFEFFMDVPDFELIPISDKKGELDLENCKILYKKLIDLSESQASDERLWAGLCHSTFYRYVRMRWRYPDIKIKTPEKDASILLSRFFFSGGIRAGFYRNTLAKYWWVGHATYDHTKRNKFELLDALGAEDFSSKVTDLFYSNTFASNPTITRGICRAWQISLRERGMKLVTRKHFRPALQYMNALGGCILLDVLSEEEIKDIFLEYIDQLYFKDKPRSIIIDEDTEEDDDEIELIDTNDNINKMQEIFSKNDKASLKNSDKYFDSDVTVIERKDKSENKNADKLNEIFGKPKTIKYGCTVRLHKKIVGEDRICKIPKENSKETWYPLHKKLLEKKIGDSVKCAGDIYEVIDIN